MKRHNQLPIASTAGRRRGCAPLTALDFQPAGARRAVVGKLALLALLLSARTHAQRIENIVTCACFAFEDAKGEPIQAPQLTKSTLLKATGAGVSSPWGMRMHPILAYLAMHWGVDIAAPGGTAIFAAASGVIEEARERGELGNYVRVRHSKTLATAYAHISHFATSVRPGVHVARGQVIAYVGSTGLSTGPHLHFEVLLNGSPIQAICACVPPPLRASQQQKRYPAEHRPPPPAPKGH